MANGQPGQRTPGHRVFLAGDGLARPSSDCADRRSRATPSPKRHLCSGISEDHSRLWALHWIADAVSRIRELHADTVPAAPELRKGQTSSARCDACRFHGLVFVRGPDSSGHSRALEGDQQTLDAAWPHPPFHIG
jgi:hypothetical protein